MPTTHWERHREPVRATLNRTLALAAIVGAALSHWWGGLQHWPRAFLLALWISLGGHFAELWFVNWLRPRLPDSRAVQSIARVGVWFVSGMLLAAGMGLTAMALVESRSVWWPPWWVGGVAFIGVELIAHLSIQLRGKPSF